MIDSFLELDIKTQAVILAAITSIITLGITLTTKSLIERKIHSSKLKSDHEYEQRKLIKDVLAKIKGI